MIDSSWDLSELDEAWRADRRKRLIQATIRAHRRFERRDQTNRAICTDQTLELATQAFRTWGRLSNAWKLVGR